MHCDLWDDAPWKDGWVFCWWLLLAFFLRTDPANESDSHIGPEPPTMKPLDSLEQVFLGVVVNKGAVRLGHQENGAEWHIGLAVAQLSGWIRV
jgi:hypothetical protein